MGAIRRDSLSWRTHKSLLAQGVSASGSVALGDVVSVAVIMQISVVRVLWRRRELEMRSVRLKLRDGTHVVLPIRGAAARLAAGTPFAQLLDELRRQRPELASGCVVPTM
ncbi:hypothetical protein ACGFW5_31375 [Streptomyces sp. NPDC048416]|uniref:hypothetical protein n=1 Tax=Streptomyces sp. NPDC048416 TaxID=3365546 RepID=UPI003712B6F5